jgi:tRNA(adenine34) deaminase
LATENMTGACGRKTNRDNEFMQRAIAIAESSRTVPGTSPIAAIIVRDGAIIGEAYNEVGCRNDPTAHAEILAIRAAGTATGQSRFAGAVLYSTLQPCGMCTMAMIWAGIKTVVYGARRDQVHQMYFEDQHFDITDFIRDAFRNDMDLQGGVHAGRCADLYYAPDDEPPRADQANLPPGRDSD